MNLSDGVIRLEKAVAFHKIAAEQFKQEFLDNGETVINGSALLDQLPFD